MTTRNEAMRSNAKRLVSGDPARNKKFHSEPYPPPEFFGEKGELKNGKRFEDEKVAFMWPLESRKKVRKMSASVKIFHREAGYAKFFCFRRLPPSPGRLLNLNPESETHFK